MSTPAQLSMKRMLKPLANGSGKAVCSGSIGSAAVVRDGWKREKFPYLPDIFPPK
jgi:hypothetical protein